jgi:hypothetical protein
MPTSFFIGGEIGFQKIGKKEDSQNKKHNKQLNQNNKPHLAAPTAHIFKTTDVESPDLD